MCIRDSTTAGTRTLSCCVAMTAPSSAARVSSTLMWERPAAAAPRTRQGSGITKSLSHMDSKAPGRLTT
eukprot:5423211-Alexandrium_andersonii.AAC.1